MMLWKRKTLLGLSASWTLLSVGRAAEPEAVMIEAHIKIVTLKKAAPETEAFFVDADDKPTAAVVVAKSKADKWIEAVSAAHATELMQAPALTVHQNQTGKVCVGDSLVMHTGVEVQMIDGVERLNVKAETVSLMTQIQLTCLLDANGDKVRVKFRYELPTLANPNAASAVVVMTQMQAGGTKVPVTFLLRDPKVNTQTLDAAATAECGRTMAFRIPGDAPAIVMNMPVTRLPYVGRLFKMKSAAISRESVALITLRKVKPTEDDEKISAPAK